MLTIGSDKPFIWVKRKWTILLIPKIPKELTFLRETFFLVRWAGFYHSDIEGCS